MVKSCILTVVTSLLICGTALGDELPLGTSVEGSASSETPARYTFTAEGPGVLTLILRGEEGDFFMELLGMDGQSLPDVGRLDTDFDGLVSAEQGIFIITEPGNYEIVVDPRGDNTPFVFGASWILSDAFIPPHDPQGSAEEALELGLDETIRGQLDFSIGDRVDWYRYEANASGTLTVATRTEDGDVALELYRQGNLGFPEETSDQDINGDTGHESISIPVSEGDVLYFVVKPVFGGEFEYAIRGILTE